jgi:hypothetical protein
MRLTRAALCLALMLLGGRVLGQQPPEPADINPVNGEVVYLINQASGLQADLNNGSTMAGDKLLLESRNFTSLTQRWAMTRIGSAWASAICRTGCASMRAAGRAG